jgi:hypothetical protein
LFIRPWSILLCPVAPKLLPIPTFPGSARWKRKSKILDLREGSYQMGKFLPYFQIFENGGVGSRGKNGNHPTHYYGTEPISSKPGGE